MIRISEFVRAKIRLGERDPDQLAREWVDAALRSDNPAQAFYQPVRNTVGSVFSRLQRALRDETEASYHTGRTSGSLLRALTRQQHNDAMVYNPRTGVWKNLGEATVADFRAAIEAHESVITGLRATQRTYERYISMIEEAGVSCLNEVAGWQEERTG